MKCKSRKKAWIGAAISAATSLAGAGLNAYLQNNAEFPFLSDYQ